MTKKTGFILGGVGLVVILLITFISLSFSIKGEANALKQKLPAQKSTVESKLSSMNSTLKDFIGATKMESKTFLEFQEIVAKSKEGQSLGGMMTAITEVYPNFDVQGFKKIYPQIESQRKEFHNEQVIYNDLVREYNTYITDPFNSMFISSSEHTTQKQFVVSTTSAKKSMETGVDDTELDFSTE